MRRGSRAIDLVLDRRPSAGSVVSSAMGELVARCQALLREERAQEALVLAGRGVGRYPQEPRLHHLTGLALLKLDLLEQGIGALYCALGLAGEDIYIHADLAAALVWRGESAAALAHGAFAFERMPSAAHGATLSCALIEQGRLREALEIADAVLARGERCPELLVNRSIVLEGLGRDAEAVVSAREAVALAPEQAVIEHHLAALLLGQGQLTAEAWTFYEARLRLRGTRAWPADPPRWAGEDVRGATVLLHAEQGLGDTLQFVRYAPMVAALGARVVLVVQPSLKRLLERVAGPLGVAEVLAVGGGLPAFDWYCPLLSLPRVFGTVLETVPGVVRFGPRALARAPGELRVGLAWAGSAGFIEDRKRSFPPELLGILGGIEGIQFYSLQFPASGILVGSGIVDLMGGVGDMADTADRIAGLDLVVTVDTAVAHLAGAMGKPVWLLSRFRGCWRWLGGREDSPWYPSLTVFRQARMGDWEEVLSRVRAALVELAVR